VSPGAQAEGYTLTGMLSSVSASQPTLRIISGGQTGVDVAALRAARSHGIPTGWDRTAAENSRLLVGAGASGVVDCNSEQTTPGI
jgi:hypothetical protein